MKKIVLLLIFCFFTLFLVNFTYAVVGGSTHNITEGLNIHPLYTSANTGYWVGHSEGPGRVGYTVSLVIYEKNGSLRNKITSYEGPPIGDIENRLININNKYILSYSTDERYHWLYNIANNSYVTYGLPQDTCSTKNKISIQNHKIIILCYNKLTFQYNKFILDLTNSTVIGDGHITEGLYNALPKYKLRSAIASPKSGYIIDVNGTSIDAHHLDRNDIIQSNNIFISTDFSIPRKFFYNFDGSTGAFSYDSRIINNPDFGSSQALKYDPDIPGFVSQGGINLQYFDNGTNTAYGLTNDYIEDIGRPEQFIITAEGIYYTKNKTSPTVYLYSGDITSGLVEFVSGGAPDTSTTPTTTVRTPRIIYDTTIWDWDTDGDGDVEVLNGEVFVGIGKFFKYIFEKTITFFSNIKNLIEKLGEAFTSEVKTLSLNSWLPSANAVEISSIINDNVDATQYKTTVLGKIDLLIKGFIAFLILCIGLGFFISSNKPKKDD